MPNPVVHFEIGCKDGERCQDFYAKLFDWGFESYGPARMINTGASAAAGINGHLNSLGHEPHNYTVVYIQVDDIPAYCAKAEKLGGKTIVPQQEVPGMGHFAWIADPEGTFVGLWKPMQG
ncbi:MAG: VOC family protein [Phycisphaerales bacterium]